MIRLPFGNRFGRPPVDFTSAVAVLLLFFSDSALKIIHSRISLNVLRAYLTVQVHVTDIFYPGKGHIYLARVTAFGVYINLLISLPLPFMYCAREGKFQGILGERTG